MSLLTVFGIDFGSGSLKICRNEHGVVYNEKNTIAKAGKDKVVAFGDTAYEMLEKTPDEITISNPIRNGVITDIDDMQYMFDSVMKKLSGFSGHFIRPGFLVAVPFDITEVERKAFYDVIESSVVRPRSVLLIEKSIADAVGIGLDVIGTKGMMVVDVGAETTEISVMSLGGIVISKLITTGGSNLDDDIRIQVRKHHNVHIGNKTAEILKKDLATADGSGTAEFTAFGRHVLTGLPTEVQIKEQVIMDAIIDHLMGIIDAVKMVLERTPPEISSDIKKSGIYLTGGSALIPDLKELINVQTGLNVIMAEDCNTSAVTGLEKISEDPVLMKFFKNARHARIN